MPDTKSPSCAPRHRRPAAPRDKVRQMDAREPVFELLNSILTICRDCMHLPVVRAFALPWIQRRVEQRKPSRECREVLDGATGGCFSVLWIGGTSCSLALPTRRAQYWRPTVAFVLLFFAAAPVCSMMCRVKLLVFTGSTRSWPFG